ncbi:MAG: ParB/RepB/Spo0J family partition protein [Sandaracinobacter sp.]
MGGGEFRQLPVELIDVPADRARLLNPLKAEAIGGTMKAERQFDPITVSPGADGRFILVDGQHRLHGARHVGLPTIEARVIPLSAAEQRRQEVLSNLAVAELDALSRARNIAALCDILIQQDGRRKRGRPSKKDVQEQAHKIGEGANTIFHWSAEAAEAVGLHPRRVYEYLRVARRIAPELTKELSNTLIADNLQALLKLADCEEAEQASVARAFNGGAFKTVQEARDSLSGKPRAPEPDRDEKVIRQIEALFARLPRKLKVRVLGSLMQDSDIPSEMHAAREAAQ